MKGRLVPARELDRGERRAMFELFARSFENARRASFEADLEDKDRVLLLEEPGAGLRGFSTLRFYRAADRGETLNVVYSGDTIVDPEAWGSSVLASAWIAAVKRLHRERPAARLVWLLIVSGYRTYRFLPVFWREFFPRHDREAPPEVRGLMERLAGERFGDAYDRQAGIVRLPEPQVLAADLRGIPAERLGNRHVAFFARANPGHEAGDELVCFAELSGDNLTPAGRRMGRRGEASLLPLAEVT